MAFIKAKIVVVPLGEVDFMLVNKLATNIGPVFSRSVDILKGMKKLSSFMLFLMIS